MANIAINGDSLNTGVFTPATVSSSQIFVTIQGTAIVKQGDSVSTHSYDDPSTGTVPDEVHAGATMQSSQNFVTIEGVPIVVNGDSATCSSSHTVIATGFVTI